MDILYASDEDNDIDAYDFDGNLIASFAQTGFTSDREGIAIYNCPLESYIIVSDQFGNSFNIYNDSDYSFIGSFQLGQTTLTDGIEVLEQSLSKFPSGLF